MPFYTKIKVLPTDSPQIQGAKIRTAQRLVDLKKALDDQIPAKQVDGTLLLATWNLRELGEGPFRGWAGEKVKITTLPDALPTAGDDDDDNDPGMKGRFQESIYFLAEIINRFDLVALQEVRDDLEDLNALREILGSWWQHLITDVTAGSQGNRERVCFLYDERKIRFGGLAGEIVLPPASGGVPTFQLARTPYVVGFRAGWFRFTICSTHLYYGQSKADDPQRVNEMDLLAGTLAAEVKKPTAWAKNTILLGDFNIFSTADEEYKILTQKHKFTVPKSMIGKATNTGANHPYDQIVFIAPSLTDQLDLSKSGAFAFFEHVFKEGDEAIYVNAMGANYEKDSHGKARTTKGKTTYYRTWRTFQMSDHNPLWVELFTDFSKGYLTYLAKPPPAPPG